MYLGIGVNMYVTLLYLTVGQRKLQSNISNICHITLPTRLILIGKDGVTFLITRLLKTLLKVLYIY